MTLLIIDDGFREVEVLLNGRPLPWPKWKAYEVTPKRIRWAEQGGEVHYMLGTDYLVVRPRGASQ